MSAAIVLFGLFEFGIGLLAGWMFWGDHGDHGDHGDYD